MAYSQSPFYAYVKHTNSDFTYVAVFASRTVADLWWRAVSTSASSKIRDGISRKNSQFYTQRTLSDAAATLTDAQGSPQLRDQIFFTLINGVGTPGFTIIPSDPKRDLVSGQLYYIRSVTDPTVYWCEVAASKTDRMSYRVSRVDPKHNGTIMIGSDEVQVTIGTTKPLVFVEIAGRGLVVCPAGENTPQPVTFTLDFLLGSRILSAREPFNELWLMEEGLGEAWELV